LSDRYAALEPHGQNQPILRRERADRGGKRRARLASRIRGLLLAEYGIDGRIRRGVLLERVVRNKSAGRTGRQAGDPLFQRLSRLGDLKRRLQRFVRFVEAQTIAKDQAFEVDGQWALSPCLR
jgi:hypothetical protein